MLALVAQTHTSSEAAILWFLHAHYLEHGRGASKEQILLNAKISERTFKRAWPKLRDAGLVVDERTYSITAAGIAHLKSA